MPTLTRRSIAVNHAQVTCRRWLHAAAIALAVIGLWGTAARLRGGVERAEFPPEITRFAPASENPVFKAGGPGSWDAKIRERGWILREGTLWDLFYTGYDGTREGIKRLGH